MSYGKCADDAPGDGDAHTSYCGTWMSSLTYGRIGQRLSCFDPQWDVEQDILFGVSLSDLLCYTQPWPLGGPFAPLLMNPLNDLLGNWTSPGGSVHAAALQSPPPGPVRRGASPVRRRRSEWRGGAAACVPFGVRTHDLTVRYVWPAAGRRRLPRRAAGRRGALGRRELRAHTALRPRPHPAPDVPGTPALGPRGRAPGAAARGARSWSTGRSPSPPRVRVLGPLSGEQFGAAGGLVASGEADDPMATS